MKLSSLVAVAAFASLLTTTFGQTENGPCSTLSEGENYRGDPTRNDCSVFYSCQNDRWVMYRCAVGLVFNPLTQLCDFPIDSPSCSTPTPPVILQSNLRIVPQNVCVMPCGSVDAMYPMLSSTGINCTGYYVCQGSRLYEGSCVDLGAGFNYYNTFYRSCSRTIDPWNWNCY